jgi:hypothetical protein
MTKVRIEFERGGVFVARLLEDEAPTTCAALKATLPAEIRFRHSMVCGRAIASVKLPPAFTPEKENQRIQGIPPGTLSLLVRDKVIGIGYQMYVSYGIFSSRLVKLDMKHPVNVFAQIDEAIDQLFEVSERILMSGAETVRFEVVR